ncbi:glycosyltransferase family 2 protein [Marinobacter mangrovi]|uniref:glycosyltransferase family 2 protein n=1 Tax=Marinobacter mangrovi TaxID=2803918 RepID=UPI002E2AC95F|nr:glycosyltransferase family 2 protein [Marinobacter mangrovi]
MTSLSAERLRPLLLGLLSIGLAGTLIHPAILYLAAIGMALGGIAARRRAGDWEIPRELRLVHFAFWGFVLLAAIATGAAVSDKSLAGSAWPALLLLLFWPLTTGMAAIRLAARDLFTAVAAASLLMLIFSATTHPARETAQVTLLLTILSGWGAWMLFRENGTMRALFCVAAVIAGLVASGLILNQSHGIQDKAWALAALGDMGALQILGWILLLSIPVSVSIPFATSRHPAARAMAVAALITAVFLVIIVVGGLAGPASLAIYLLLMAPVMACLFVELDRGDHRPRAVRISATIITKNEADNIEDCLRSVRAVADEIIVLDSGSSDDTVAKARALADVVEVTDWPGFGIQKQRALEKATGDWVLSIDADERITPALAREINDRLSAPDADAYKLPWAVTLYGTRLDFGRSGRAPLRLFRREGVRFSDALVHERILIPEGRTTKTLRGRLTHFTHRDFGHALEKSAKYAWLGSREKFRRGKRARTLSYATFRGILTFIQVYLIRLGFLDGPVGYLVAVNYAQGSFNKYAGLWTLSRTEHRGEAAD